ncbi:protein transport protein Sec61 subunit alphaisoform 1 [Striga asiatica]|uniref:Protein transport protein Sec61 subunit alphaisoform 1 n=1 Tax=Striga asiatica TaxID=4170 RepID=A0A5A7P070_STRAF|nr:protein transport protein Sec61 subunit alphaisoform 1 [Striga asiatica]
MEASVKPETSPPPHSLRSCKYRTDIYPVETTHARKTAQGDEDLGAVRMKPEVAISTDVEVGPLLAGAVLGPARAAPAGGEVGPPNSCQLVLMAPVHHLDRQRAHEVQLESTPTIRTLVQGGPAHQTAPAATIQITLQWIIINIAMTED